MTRSSSLLRLFLALLCCCMLSACGKPAINLSVASQPNVNPDFNGRPSPVIVKMYELRQNVAFNAADFLPLFETPLQVLGADLIAADELVFIPGEARKVKYELDRNTQYIGLVAGFRQMERGVWRIIKPVDSESANWVAMELSDTSIILVPDKEAKDWEPTQAVRTYQQRLPQAQQQYPQAQQQYPQAQPEYPQAQPEFPDLPEPPEFSDLPQQGKIPRRGLPAIGTGAAAPQLSTPITPQLPATTAPQAQSTTASGPAPVPSMRPVR